ncbi:uncharacterized protein LOC143202489 [Rhynchophorus ferrugineus]|uniref:uncharacterized protein LOC143202489 n=1 Tax=Rhynchophorus ferrugineus TaxID=354439 RepID=UPI003FCEBDE7
MTDVLSLEDYHTVVRHYLDIENFVVINYVVKPFFSEVNGFLGEHLLLEVTVRIDERERTLRFFAKRFPFGHRMQSRFLESMHGWQREIYFFEKLIPALRDTLPNYEVDFLPRYFLGRPNSFIVFEDLTLRNYDLPRQANLNMLDNQHICLALKSLAKYHAGYLAYEEHMSRKSGGTFRLFTGREEMVLEPLLRKQEGFLGYDWFKAGVKGLRALIGRVYSGPSSGLEKVEEKYNVLVEKALQLLFPHDHFRCVLTHGDMWGKNIMYQYDGDGTDPLNAVLVDFQLQRYNVPIHDVLLFVSLTTDRSTRQKYFHFYLRTYHQALCNELASQDVTPEQVSMTYDDLLKSVNFIMPEIQIQGPLQRLQQCGNKDFFRNLLQDKEQYIKYIFDDKTPFALELFDTDANFKQVLTEAVEDVIEASLYPEVSREDCYRILEDKLGDAEYDLRDYVVETVDGKKYLYKLILNVSGLECRKYEFLVKNEPFDFPRIVQEL